MTEKYPYFIYPDVIALKDCQDPDETMRLRRRIAANVGDIPALRLMLGMDPEEFARFYPDMSPATMSTTDTIDSFLAHFGQPDAPVSKATAEIGTDYTYHSDDRIGIPVAAEEYTFEQSDTEDRLPDDSTSSAINSFLTAMSPKKPESAPPKKTEPAPQDRPETELDARNCIKNHDYQKALEIIMRLRLNNPEKSIYFADQIRFLRKLILNQAKQNNYNS